MSNQPLKTPKAARRKVTTDLGRQIIQRERQRLAREQALLGEQLAAEAKHKMAMQQTNKRQVQPEQIAVSRGIVRRFSAVLQSEGVNVKIIARSASEMSAWTDFEQIVLNYRLHDDVRLLAATMRGLAYHEGGHCRFTLPFIQLIEAAGLQYNRAQHNQYHKAWNMLEDQRMETAVVSDSPVKAKYLTPVILTEMAENVNMAAANWPLFIWRKYLPRKVRRGARTLFVAKHDLMGVNGEELAKAWQRVTSDYVMADNAVAMWAAVLTAHELLKITNALPALQGDQGHEQQQRQRKDDLDLDDVLVIPVDPSMMDDGDMIDMDDETVVIDTTDPAVAEHLANIFVALFSYPETLLRVVYAVPQPSDETASGRGSSSQPSEEDGDESDESEADEEDASDPEGDSTVGGSKDGDADEADETEDENGGDDSDEATDDGDDDWNEAGDEDDADEEYANDGPRESGVNPEREGGAEGEHDDEPVADDLDYKPAEDDEDDDSDLDDDALADALQDAEDERDADEALDGDVNAFHDAIDNRVSDLTPYVTHASADIEATAAAHNLADELEQSFYASTMDSAPQWVEQQRRGVLNVMRYVTRQPGDAEFFKQWTEEDAPGFNLAVSVLLDYSGSMGGYTAELAQAAYAAKLACEKLGIPCTVTLWDTNAQVLWDANELADYLPVIQSAGGTNPTVALADLVNQRFDKAQHVVLIMTDGEWQDNAAAAGYLASYSEQGRVIIGCGFNSGYGTSEALAEKLRRYGCDESYAIKELIELPRLLEQTLVAVS